MRALQMGMATASQWLFNFVVAKSTPSMFATLGRGGFGTYFIYGSFCFAMVVFAWVFVPETKGNSFSHSYISRFPGIFTNRAIQVSLLRTWMNSFRRITYEPLLYPLGYHASMPCVSRRKILIPGLNMLIKFEWTMQVVLYIRIG